MSLGQVIKDSNAVLDFVIDWAEWLGVDTIATSSWTVAVGLTKFSETNTNVAATVWLAGGVIGQLYEVRNHITTAAGRIDDRSFSVLIQEK